MPSGRVRKSAGGAADRAGMKSGDVIVVVDGTTVPSSEDFRASSPGTRWITREVEVLRGGNRQTLASTSRAEGGHARADQKHPRGGNGRTGGLGIEIVESPNRKGEVVVVRVCRAARPRAAGPR